MSLGSRIFIPIKKRQERLDDNPSYLVFLIVNPNVRIGYQRDSKTSGVQGVWQISVPGFNPLLGRLLGRRAATSDGTTVYDSPLDSDILDAAGFDYIRRRQLRWRSCSWCGFLNILLILRISV